VTAGLIARELGGRVSAQMFAAVAVAVGTVLLLGGHLLSTASIDLVFWAVLTWLAVRLARTRDQRLWLPFGVLAGVALVNKQLVLVLLLGLTIGVAATLGWRSVARSPWLWAGAVAAVGLWIPVLTWQAEHGWPQLKIAGQIRAEYGTTGQRVGFVVAQLVLFSLGASIVWVVGIIWSWRQPGHRHARVLVWSWVVVLVVFLVTAGQAYYPAGTYPGLIAAGAVALQDRRRLRWALLGVVVATSALTVPVALPVLPADVLGRSPWSGAAEVQRETVGWPELVASVAAAYHSLPPAQQQHAVIYATNYGEAGAIDRFGPQHDLPPAWSGHNGYGLWGPPPEGGQPVVVVWEDNHPDTDFTGCHLVATIHDVVTNEESQRAAIYLCASPIGGWATAWPHLQHLSN
jgi:hypothetical protein